MSVAFVIADAAVNAENGKIVEIRIGADIDIDLLEERIIQIHGPGKVLPRDGLSILAGQRGDTGQASARSHIDFNDHAFR